MPQEARVYVVATPIGNVEDLSARARRVLAEVDLIAAEDTRHTANLLKLLGIAHKQLVSYHDHIEEQRAGELIERIKHNNLHLAVVSDAGTPCIADPGFRIVAKARLHHVRVIPIPGPSALTTLASVAGLPTDRLLFVGFLPSKRQALLVEINSWKAVRASIVCYEAARRLEKTLETLSEVWPSAKIAIARELTKLYEEIVLLDLPDALAWAKNHPSLKGELTLMIQLGTRPVDAQERIKQVQEEARALVVRGASHRDLMGHFAGCGLDRKQLYGLLLELFKTS